MDAMRQRVTEANHTLRRELERGGHHGPLATLHRLHATEHMTLTELKAHAQMLERHVTMTQAHNATEKREARAEAQRRQLEQMPF